MFKHMATTSRFVPMPSRDRETMSPSDMLARYEAELVHVPDSGLLHHGRGIALMALGRPEEAGTALERALYLAPRHADIWVSIGDLNLAKKKKALARFAFSSALSIDELTPGALDGFHKTAGFVGRWLKSRTLSAQQRAREHGRRESDPGAAQVLAEAARLGKSQHHAEAIDVIRKFLETCPGHVAATATLSALLAGLGNVTQGQVWLERLVQWWPASAQAAYCLGTYLITSGRRDAGIIWLQRALELDPQDHANARLALATLNVGDTPRLSEEEVRRAFDDYAEKFDQDLVETLEYRVPENLAMFITKSGRRWRSALDIGCGTGLCGVHLRSQVDHLVGVDLSSKMLEKARTRKIYNELECADAVAFLARPETYDLMIAADVLIYIGDVSALFPAIAARLSPDGEFWFSVESTDQDFHITMARRYQHSLTYLEEMAQASGLRLKYHEPTDIRRHATEMQKGLIVALTHV